MSPRKEGGKKDVVSSLLLGALRDLGMPTSRFPSPVAPNLMDKEQRGTVFNLPVDWKVHRGKTGCSCKLFGLGSQAGCTCYHHVASVLKKPRLLAPPG